jgi:hypothetical protein
MVFSCLFVLVFNAVYVSVFIIKHTSQHQHGEPAGGHDDSGPKPASDAVTNNQKGDGATHTPNHEIAPSFYHRNRTFIEGVAFLAGIAVLIFGVLEMFDKVVEHKLSDPSILRKIAAESRPMLVFKGNESIVADEGAAQFIKEIKVTRRGGMGETNLPAHIHIELTKFFPQTPILTLLTPSFCEVAVERGKGFSWEFNLEYGSIPMDKDIGNQVLFRFEILP